MLHTWFRGFSDVRMIYTLLCKGRYMCALFLGVLFYFHFFGFPRGFFYFILFYFILFLYNNQVVNMFMNGIWKFKVDRDLCG